MIKEGDNPVCEKQVLASSILSRAKHAKFCLKLGRPRSNPKYSYYTDSEQVPWGKGEKNWGDQSEIEPETICLQSFRALYYTP